MFRRSPSLIERRRGSGHGSSPVAKQTSRRRQGSYGFEIVGFEEAMKALAELARWEVLGFLMAVFALVSVQLLSGQINTRGLFTGEKRDGTLYFSPERVQLLLFTLGAAFQLLSSVLRDPTRFPVVPESW